MTTAPQCSTKDCTQEAITAIRNTAPRGKALVTTIWQDEADAPKTAARYCGKHGVELAANLASLTDADLHPVKVVFP